MLVYACYFKVFLLHVFFFNYGLISGQKFIVDKKLSSRLLALVTDEGKSILIYRSKHYKKFLHTYLHNFINKIKYYIL